MCVCVCVCVRVCVCLSRQEYLSNDTIISTHFMTL